MPKTSANTENNVNAPVKPDISAVLRTMLVTPSDKWIESGTSIPNISVQRAPPTEKKSASLAVQLKLPGAFRNKLTITSETERKEYLKALNDPRLPALIAAVHVANGTAENPLEGSIIVL